MSERDAYPAVRIRYLGRQPYSQVCQAMREFTDQRNENTVDELWVIEHDPVFTQGQAGKAEHVLNPGDIPVVKSDRGGQVTYHGPGQLVIYLLCDLRRLNIGIKKFVCSIEKSVIACLNHYGIQAKTREHAPGVYVDGAKICSVGLRVRKGSSYHGLSLNVAMDLEPFSRINPCGFSNLTMTQVSQLGGPDSIEQVTTSLLSQLKSHLGYSHVTSSEHGEVYV